LLAECARRRQKFVVGEVRFGLRRRGGGAEAVEKPVQVASPDVQGDVCGRFE
jgi:hypothetical protein